MVSQSLCFFFSKPSSWNCDIFLQGYWTRDKMLILAWSCLVFLYKLRCNAASANRTSCHSARENLKGLWEAAYICEVKEVWVMFYFLIVQQEIQNAFWIWSSGPIPFNNSPRVNKSNAEDHTTKINCFGHFSLSDQTQVYVRSQDIIFLRPSIRANKPNWLSRWYCGQGQFKSGQRFHVKGLVCTCHMIIRKISVTIEHW